MKYPDELLVSRLSLALMEQLPRRHNGGSVVLVTSALAGEGKSFVARLLAMSASELGESDVCFVATQGVSEDAGFSELLDGLPVYAAPVSASDRLFEMSAGRAASHAALFQPRSVARAVASLRPRFGLSVIDGTTVAQCGALLQHVDRVLMVVDSRTTPPSAIRRSLAQAGADVAGLVSVVLNHAPSRGPSWMDGY